MEKKSKLRVLVIDGVPLTRFALVSLIQLHSRHEVCAEAADAPAARRRCAEELPDAIVLALEIPRGDGVELLRELHKLNPAVRMMVVSEREDLLSVQRAFRAGARAYVTKLDERNEVLTGLERIAAGDLYASQRISHLLLDQIAHGRERKSAENLESLSDREMHIFRLLGRRLGATAISHELGISVKTVETHQQRIKHKLGLVTARDLHKKSESWTAQIRSRS